METNVFKAEASHGVVAGHSPFLRLQPDDRLVAYIRGGSISAFEILFKRYQARLFAFCRHMLRSSEDAEDVLQEVFSSAYNAMRADDRDLQVRPWLYRIARNRCLNHLRKPTADGQDSMDIHTDNGGTTADRVYRRAAFRDLVEDVGELPESQRAALLLREIDQLSYDQIAEAMETTVPSVKSLLVRARVSLAEAAEAREMTCDEVRLELGEVAEGLRRSSPPIRRHVRQCDQCKKFKAQLKQTSRGMHAVYPVGALFIFKRVLSAKLAALTGGGATAGGGAITGSAGIGGTVASSVSSLGAAAGTTAVGSAGTGLLGGAIGTKVVVGATAATIAAGAAIGVEKQIDRGPLPSPVAVQQSKPRAVDTSFKAGHLNVKVKPAPAPVVTEQPAPEPVAAVVPEEQPAPAPEPVTQPDSEDKVAEDSGTTTLPDQPASTPDQSEPADGGTSGVIPPPGETAPADPGTNVPVTTPGEGDTDRQSGTP